jgi:PST family polysaccharide transporter
MTARETLPEAPEPAGLGRKAATGAAWSGVSTIVLRLGSVLVGIVLARILTPDQFGVYAIALTVQGILMTVADLGLSAELIRSDDPERIAPTVATFGLISGAGLTVDHHCLQQPVGGTAGKQGGEPSDRRAVTDDAAGLASRSCRTA